MDHQLLVSVGIPTYNRPEGLRRTLGYITQQTYKNLEIIVSDNCSPDTEVERVLKEFKEKDSRVQFFRQGENIGAINNFKFVLEKATGEYFMWAADDDQWELDFVEKNLYSILSDTRYIASFSNFCQIDVNGNKLNNILDYLPYLKNISDFDKYKRLRNYLFQHEKYGKATFFYSLIKTEILKKNFSGSTKTIPFANDALLVLSLLCEGNLALIENVLFRSIVGNKKFYLPNIKLKKSIRLLFIKINPNVFYFTRKGFLKYLYAHYSIISKCDLGFFNKFKLFSLVCFRILLVYYDIITYSCSTPGYDLFWFLRRKNGLINFDDSNFVLHKTN
jgi:glycosyltransferase involved in cell wall biosynthesis